MRNTKPEVVAVLGAGAWGTALAALAADGHAEVRLWARDADLAARIARDRENGPYLPGVPLPSNVRPTGNLAETLPGAGLVILAPPSHGFRQILTAALPSLDPRAILLSGTKGIEVESLLTMSGVMAQSLSRLADQRIAVLSGPSFAREVSQRLPTAVVAAAAEGAVAAAIQEWLSRPSFRVYAATDVLGVELGGAIKNVIAIAAGIVDGLGLGSNARAALITRGLAEMARLGAAMGARRETLAGLAGMGDLFLTCTGDLSRNRGLGVELAKGAPLSEVLRATRTVAEGVNTARAAAALARRHGVEMPICQKVREILFEGKAARDAVLELMGRDLKFEEE